VALSLRRLESVYRLANTEVPFPPNAQLFDNGRWTVCLFSLIRPTRPTWTHSPPPKSRPRPHHPRHPRWPPFATFLDLHSPLLTRQLFALALFATPHTWLYGSCGRRAAHPASIAHPFPQPRRPTCGLRNPVHNTGACLRDQVRPPYHIVRANAHPCSYESTLFRTKTDYTKLCHGNKGRLLLRAVWDFGLLEEARRVAQAE